jgi:class 3 adenylate cyclase/tetratricopeptide (TPR) repeat protein
VTVCAVCGYEAVEAFKFCPDCGTASEPAGHEQRKVVTVLFCDVVGSTGLGESTDPETLRALLARYFARMKGIVERHGGTVEKFIGDAVMAVFGVPQVHEDDALRACRAAIEMRDALPGLGVDGRIGVTTGEIVTGTLERLATGDAVNVAARLQQAAQPGQVLVGGPTLELVGEAVEVETLEPLVLKGKARAVEAHRLLAVYEAPERQHGPRFVGRAQELEAICEAWELALREERCELVTVVGEAGVGKSRLVAEALSRLDARVAQGRCLPYGDGITYWPVVETIKQLGALPSDPAAAASIRSLLGETEAGTSAEEIAWAFRKLLEEAAPLICVFDDIQWGEETFLDLLEHVALLSSGSALVLLCMARLELAERRSSWPVRVRLDPLPGDVVEELIGDQASNELRQQIAKTAGGNPLFVSEMLAMAGEANGDVTVPPTLRSLLAARLDQLDPTERRVLESGAVEGEVFHRGAVQALAPEERQITPRLAALVRKELIRPDRAQLPGEDGFRFRHLLIRDAAYEGLPKATRAELHERYAAWLQGRDNQLVELDELVGHHLEQAVRYGHELGRSETGLATRAGEQLAAAGIRAASRSDYPASRTLLTRALELLPRDHSRRAELLLTLGTGLAALGKFPEAEAGLSTAIETARAGDDRVLELRAVLKRAEVRTYAASASFDQGRLEAEAALAELELLDDDRGLSEGLLFAGKVRMWLGEAGAAEEAYERGLERAQKIGDRQILADLCGWLGWTLLVGPAPIEQALVRIAALRERFGGDPVTGTWLQIVEAGLDGFGGRLDVAAERLDGAVARAYEFGMAFMGANAISEIGYYFARAAGRTDEAEQRVREGYEKLAAMGEQGMLSTRAAFLADVRYEQGRLDEAEALARESSELAADDDLMSQSCLRSVRAKILARRGEHEEARRLAREAVAIVERTDWLDHRGRTLEDLAAVLKICGEPAEAAEASEQAAELFERKGMHAAAERLRTTS